MTLDTHPNITFTVNYDSDDFDGTATCVSHPQTEFEEALVLVKRKNLEIVPALLAALPASEKIKDVEGNDTFKTQPKFLAENGKIAADFNHIKDASAKGKVLAVLNVQTRIGG